MPVDCKNDSGWVQSAAKPLTIVLIYVLGKVQRLDGSGSEGLSLRDSKTAANIAKSYLGNKREIHQ